MEKKVKWTNVMGKTVNGCISYNRDILLSIDYEDENDFSNFYLTQSQGYELIEQLQKRLKQNEEE